MGASVASADRRMGWGFLIGRTLGVLGLLLLIGLVGAHLLPSKEWLTAIFAGTTIAVAVVLAVSTYRPSLLGGCAGHTHVSCDGGEPDGTTIGDGCPQDCEGCGAATGVDGGCDHVPSGLMRRLSGRSPWVAGLAVGGFRGAMPCLKVLIVTPLLVASPPGTVVAMAIAFTATSTVYPAIGLLSGRLMTDLLDRGRRIRLAGAVGVAAVGIITLVRFYQRTCAV
jgi:hypothetical protein